LFRLPAFFVKIVLRRRFFPEKTRKVQHGSTFRGYIENFNVLYLKIYLINSVQSLKFASEITGKTYRNHANVSAHPRMGNM
jgi:cytosine/uracil/thiamine/allantoin permease